MGVKPKVNHRRYWSIFLLVGSLLSGAANYSVKNISKHLDDEQRYGQSRVQSRNILSDVIDAETGIRGFLLTNNHEYLRPYHEAVGRLQLDLANFKVRVPQVEKVQVVEELVGKVINEFVTEIETADKQSPEPFKEGQPTPSTGIEAARRRFLNNPTKPSVDAIRDVIATVRAQEGEALDQTREQLRASIATATNLLNVSTYGGLVMSLALATSLLSPPGTEDE